MWITKEYKFLEYLNSTFCYSYFNIKGTFSVQLFNDDYLSIPEHPGSQEYLFNKISGMLLFSQYLNNLFILIIIYHIFNYNFNETNY